jgi:hypothetical protein
MLFPDYPSNRDPSNPYVIDPYYFKNSTNRYVYDQTWLALIHNTINYVAFGLGSLLTLLIIYLIVFRTPKHFQAYKQILTMCTAMDVCYLLTDICLQLVGLTKGL